MKLTSISFINRGKTGFLFTAISGKCGQTSGTTTVAGKAWWTGYSASGWVSNVDFEGSSSPSEPDFCVLKYLLFKNTDNLSEFL